MTPEKFKKILDTRLGKIVTMLDVKGAEYARADRLHNFKRAAEIDRVSPEVALKGMVLKQWVSILDMVDDIDTRSWPLEMWEEKIGDSINYLILLEALVKERYNHVA